MADDAVMDRRRARWTGWACALATAILVTLSLPTTEVWPLSFVAWVPLLLALRGRSGGARFRLGWLTGFLFQLVLFRWIPFTMAEMTAMPAPVTWGMWLLYGAWHGLQTGLFAWLTEPLRRLCERHVPALGPFAVAVTYAVIEWAFPALFPWSWGHAIWEVAPLATPLLSLQGVPLMTAYIVLPGAVLADLGADWLERRPHLLRGLRRDGARPRWKVPLALLLLLPLVGTGLRSVLIGEEHTSLRVAVIQPNFTLEEKKKADLPMRKRLLARIETQIRALPANTYDLVVGTEGSFPMWWRLDADQLPATGQPYQVEATRRVQRAVAEGPKTHVILGGLRQTPTGVRNAAVHFGPDGRISGHFDKKTLVPFSEYVPLSDTFPALKNIKGIGHMERGDAPCRFDADMPISCGICYESMFADDTRADMADSRLIANLTIDTWFGRSTAPRMHLMSHASRAAELGVPLVRGALTGVSAVIDARGQVLEALPQDVEGVLDVNVNVPNGTTFYREIGQIFAPLGAVAMALAFAVLARERRRG
jgi:apolipoprotein N-acyltransferase